MSHRTEEGDEDDDHDIASQRKSLRAQICTPNQANTANKEPVSGKDTQDKRVASAL